MKAGFKKPKRIYDELKVNDVVVVNGLKDSGEFLVTEVIDSLRCRVVLNDDNSSRQSPKTIDKGIIVGVKVQQRQTPAQSARADIIALLDRTYTELFELRQRHERRIIVGFEWEDERFAEREREFDEVRAALREVRRAALRREAAERKACLGHKQPEK